MVNFLFLTCTLWSSKLSLQLWTNLSFLSYRNLRTFESVRDFIIKPLHLNPSMINPLMIKIIHPMIWIEQLKKWSQIVISSFVLTKKKKKLFIDNKFAHKNTYSIEFILELSGPVAFWYFFSRVQYLNFFKPLFDVVFIEKKNDFNWFPIWSLLLASRGFKGSKKFFSFWPAIFNFLIFFIC